MSDPEFAQYQRGWNVRVSGEGTWKATRRLNLTDLELSAGLACTVMADSAVQLRRELAVQDRIEDELHGENGAIE